MKFLTDEKLVIVGAAGMIGSNMAQTALMLGLSSNVCLYDVFSAEGVAKEMRQCGFDEATITSTTDPAEAFKDAKYVISSGGAPRKEGMTREDLLAGNSKVAEELGQNIKKYCPDCKFLVVIFNPADITGLVALIHSGLKPNQVATLAALDSTRLKEALAQHFGISQSLVKNAYTYGGHGEKMAVFSTPTTVDGVKLTDIIEGKAVCNGKGLSMEEWQLMQKEVTQGGAKIIELRRRSSFQSPAYLSIKMMEAAMGGEEFDYPVGCYADSDRFNHVMMAMPSRVTSDGVYTKPFTGTAEELAALEESYKHLCKMRDEIISMGILPPVDKWNEINPNIH